MLLVYVLMCHLQLAVLFRLRVGRLDGWIDEFMSQRWELLATCDLKAWLRTCPSHKYQSPLPFSFFILSIATSMMDSLYDEIETQVNSTVIPIDYFITLTINHAAAFEILTVVNCILLEYTSHHLIEYQACLARCPLTDLPTLLCVFRTLEIS